MIESPAISASRPDRLSAFLAAFSLHVGVRADAGPAHLVIADDGPGRIVCFRPRAPEQRTHGRVLVAADVAFGGSANPLLQSLPDELSIAVRPGDGLWSLADYFIAEAGAPRCGREAALSRLGELLVLMLLREALDKGHAHGGVLAGLAHPQLRFALAEMLQRPDRTWTIEALADTCSMSRSHFMKVFGECVGTAPGSFLTRWRMTLARQELARGIRVKAAAGRAGYSSPAAFSRAYRRAFGEPPRVGRA